MPNKINVPAGTVFNKLQIISESETKNGHRFFLCKCACGNKTVVEFAKLRNGHTKSCGCLRNRKGKDAAAYKHGHSQGGKRSDLYNIWKNMMDRCYRETHKFFYNYGGRGIEVCSRWHDFKNFVKDMSPRPAGKSLDRINNDGHYSPKNCKWSTQKEQMRNTRINRMITHNGKTQCLVDWAEEVGIDHRIIRNRMKSGYPFIDAIKPKQEFPDPRKRLLTFAGKTQDVTAWADELDIKRDLLYQRLKRGWSIERALTHRPRQYKLD